MPLPKEVLFQDFDLNLTLHPRTKDVVLISNNDAVKRSVKNIIFTQFYERPFEPYLGSDVTHHLFENFDPITEQNIENSIIVAIENYEPRAELIDVRVNANEDHNGFDVTIEFRVLNALEPTRLDVFLERIR